MMKRLCGQKGQMMIFLVVIISAVILGAMTLSSFLVVTELKQVTDSRFSGAALFAADTGIECVLFHEFGNSDYNSVGCPGYNDITGDWSLEGIESISGSTVGMYKFRRDSETANQMVWTSIGTDSARRLTRALQITLNKKII
ncbi:MAG: hypothetical protein PHG66_02380 [Candidatus Colwellbacteria bacterium]|nr:hypothetical protein [Candidatus Colwellbacteria bacterium]